jgi:hypothetical protein
MNPKNRLVVLFSITAALVTVMLAACSTPQPTATMVPTPEPTAVPTDTPAPAAESSAGITVTFEGDQCIYHGPERMPAGRIPIILDVTDQTAYEVYGVGAATLDEGKTLEDLAATPSTAGFPLWLHDHGYVGAAQGTAQETTIVLFEGPLFLVCFVDSSSGEGSKVDALGPIEIEPVASK